MQNSTPSRNPVSAPSLLQTLLEHTFLGARPASLSVAPIGSDLPGADAAPGADPSVGDPETDAETDATDTADADAIGRLELAELLGVLRDPIEWVFTLAERGAQGDPIDIAAIHRVRDAVLHRVNAVIIGTPRAESPRIRTADLWTVASLLIDTLDPRLVERVLRGVGTSIADVLIAGLPFDPSLVARLARGAAPLPGPHVPPPVAPSWYGAAMPHLAGLCGGLCPGSLAAAHAMRPIAPPWCWSHPPVSF